LTGIAVEVEELAASLAYTAGIASETVGAADRIVSADEGKECEE